MIQQVKNSCQFHGLPGDDANKHLDKFLHVTQSIKVNGVTDDTLRLYLFPHSLTHHAIAWFDRLPRNSINTFEQMAKMFLEKYFPPFMVTKLKNEITNFRQHPDEPLFKAWERYNLSIDRYPNHNMLPVTQIDTFYNGLTLRHRDTINAAAEGTFMKRRPEECYDLIENMTVHHNDWDTSAQRSKSSSSITSSSDIEITALKAEMVEINKNLMRVLHVNQQVKAVTPNCETCGGPHSFNDCPAEVDESELGKPELDKLVLDKLEDSKGEQEQRTCKEECDSGNKRCKTLVAQDGIGYDWGDQAEDRPTDFTLMAFTSSGSTSSSSSDSEGGLISLIEIQATNFRLKNDMIQQVQNSCQFHELLGDDANKHLDKFLHVTQSIKVNGVADDALRLYLFPHSLTHHATAWFDRLPRNSFTTFEQIAKMFLGKYFPPSMVTKLRNKITNFRQRPDESLFEACERYMLSIDRCPNHNMLPITQIDTFYNGLTLRHRDTINDAVGGTFMKRRPEECYDVIENMTAHHNDWDTSVQRSESSSSITFDPEIVALKAKMAEINKNLMKVHQINKQVKAVTHNCKTCGGPHSYNDCPATMNTASSLGLGTLPSNTITNPKEYLKGITTLSGIAYKGPTIPTTPSPPKIVERETKVTKDTVPPTNNESTKDVQPSVVQIENQISNSEPIVAPVVEPVKAPVSALKPNPKPSIPYPSRLHDQKLYDKANDQKEKF
nr:reverse transcriptase domain-containing protein [Tanacetum cinerariifolium]